MIEIFNDLYKKVLGFFQTQEKEESSESKTVAVNRMKLVLMQDRTNLTPYLLERMRGEMIEVLAKYVEMDKEALELNFEQEGEQMALMLSIPVLRAKEEDEIKAILEEEAKMQRGKDAEQPEEIEESEVDEEVEETDENLEEDLEEEVCSESSEDLEEESESPDEIKEEETEEADCERRVKRKR